MLSFIMPSGHENSLLPLFWTDRYVNLHASVHKILSIEVSSSNFALFTFSDLDILKSPGRATFGGFWPSEMTGGVDLNYALRAYKYFFSKFSEFNEVKIVLPPQVFFPEIYASQAKALMMFDANQIIVDTNYHVEVENWSKNNLNKGNRKKIRQFYEVGGVVSYSNSDAIKQCYKVLVENRKRRGVSLTMQYADFESSLLVCGEDFKLIQASLEKQIVAACYLVRILPNYWYVLFWGELIEFRSLSPVASLFEFLMEEAQKNNVKILDLGISSVEGVLDEGLARFKSNLGALPSEKITVTVNLIQH